MLMNINRFFNETKEDPILVLIQKTNNRQDIQFGPMQNGVYLTPGGNFGNDIGHRLTDLGISWGDKEKYYDEWSKTVGLSQSISKELNQADEFWKNYRSDYGICDSVEQILVYYSAEIADSNRIYVIGMMPVRKKDQSPKGGWRWHKWGEYIGVHTKTTEYLYDEPLVEQIYCFHLIELLNSEFWKQWM